MICPKCNAKNDNDNMFCVVCGVKFDPPIICPKCQAKNRSDFKFCYVCGNTLVVADTSKQQTTNTQPSNAKQQTPSTQLSTINPDTENKTNSINNPNGLTRVENYNHAASQYTVFEKFYDGKEWWILTDRSIIFRNIEYPYGILSPIDLLNTPTRILNGVIGMFADGQYMALGFQLADSQRFMVDLEYANWQISKAHGRPKKYLFVFQNTLNAKIEVYADYAIYYTITKGVISTIANNFSNGGVVERIIEFSDLNVGINEQARFARFTIDNSTIDFKLTENNISRAVEIINYINQRKATPISNEINIPSLNVNWQPLTGCNRDFPILDKVLHIPESMDLFNGYMLRFRALASVCTDGMIAECERKVNDLMTFMEYFPEIYEKYLNAVLSKAIDILIADGLWSVTQESLKARYAEDNTSTVVDDLSELLNTIKQIIDNNKTENSLTMAIFPTLAGKIGDISHVQQDYLYTLIDFEDLYHDVFRDYTLVFFTMASEMKDAGKSIWYPSPDDIDKARNIYKNISHPNFPQEKKLEVLLTILSTDPYQVEYYKFLIDYWGENEQTTAIKNYFGYIDFNNPRMMF